jgi:alpha-galactosidase
MRKYGNMFRASDCPNDGIQNRVRTLDIRLLCGDTAAHADMMMWHAEEPVENAALQLIQALFSVPQVSVPLAALPADHRRMLQYWLAFWRDHRDVLLDGRLEPLNPELLYPVVRAAKAGKAVIAVYYDTVVALHASAPPLREWIVVNGRIQEGLVVEIAEPLGPAQVVMTTCCGEVIDKLRLDLQPGLYKLPVPASGTAAITLSSHGC